MEGKITTVHWLCFIYEIFLGDVSFMSLQKIIIGEKKNGIQQQTRK